MKTLMSKYMIYVLIVSVLMVSVTKSQGTSITYGEYTQSRFFEEFLGKIKRFDSCSECQFFESVLAKTGMVTLMVSQFQKAQTCRFLLSMLKVTIVDEKTCVHLLGQMSKVPQVLLEKLVVKNKGYICYVLLDICPASTSTITWFNSENYIDYIRSLPKIQPETPKTASPKNELKILHFSDAHIKLRYVEGAASVSSNDRWAACETNPASPSDPVAGHFGDPNCDAPTQLFQAFLSYAKTVNPDVIIYTGDNNDHNMLHYQNHNLMTETHFIGKSLREAFPNAVIVPTLGNIETAPQDHQFDFISGSMSWVLNAAANAYAPLLTKDQTQSMAKNGYFSSELPEYNLRVISLFSALFDSMNFFLFARTFNPNNVMDFVLQNLRDAESKGQKVILTAHVPAGSNSISQFSKVMGAIVERYSDTILAFFTGHLHRDSINFYTQLKNDNTVTAPTFTVASLSPQGNAVPSFRVWNYDVEKKILADYTQYKFDLQTANQLKDANQWSLSYQFTEVYQVPDASLESLQTLKNRFATNEAFATSKYLGLKNSYKPVEQTINPSSLALSNCDFLYDSKKIYECIKALNPKQKMSLFGISAIMYPDFMILK